MKAKSMGWAGVLTWVSVCVGALLYAQGAVGAWGMFIIVMVPNAAFYLRDTWRRCF